MPGKLNVLILFGGRSAEHEISLLSARFIVQSLDPQRFTPLLVGIDKEGRWQWQTAQAFLALPSDPTEVKLQQGHQVTFNPWPASKSTGVIHVSGQGEVAFDVVFPILHGPLGEDGALQGLLELAAVPYVGAGVLGSAVGMDKDVMKRLLLQAGLPILPYVTLRKAHYQAQPEQAQATAAHLQFPLFVKPANMGSSVGVSRVVAAQGLAGAIEQAFAYDDKIVIEQGLHNPHEVECAVLGGIVPTVSIPGEILVHHKDGFYSYAAKYLDDGATTRIPADLSPEETKAAQALAQHTFDVLECRGLARVDLFMDQDRKLYVNEINTMPGFTAISMYPKMMAHSGVPAQELVSRLIDDALLRAAGRRVLKSSR